MAAGLFAGPLAGLAPAWGQQAAKGPDAPRLLNEKDLKGSPWRSIGPANVGGRVADIGVAPGNSKTFFVGLATGGCWKRPIAERRSRRCSTRN